MPYTGYMLDLSLLIEDCLLPLDTESLETGLIDDRIADSFEPYVPASFLDRAIMDAKVALNEVVVNEAKQITGSTNSTCQSTEEQDSSDAGESGVPPYPRTNINLIPSPTTSVNVICTPLDFQDKRPDLHIDAPQQQLPAQALIQPHVVNNHALNSDLSVDVVMGNSKANSTTEYAFRAQPSWQLGVVLPDNSLEENFDHLSNKPKRGHPPIINSPSDGQQQRFHPNQSLESASGTISNFCSTLQEMSHDLALATRTSADVIADLKNSRQTNSETKQGSVPVSYQTSVKSPTTKLDNMEDISGDFGEEEEEEDVEDDGQRVVDPHLDRPRKITERKRQFNATFDKYFQSRLQEQVKQGTIVKLEDEEKQSARWLVSQSENRQIISTPREYQNELFQKAKEKNIIAVLDTGNILQFQLRGNLMSAGSGKTLIAVLLLRHTFAQELEDRAMGKPKRISFFLVFPQI